MTLFEQAMLAPRIRIWILRPKQQWATDTEIASWYADACKNNLVKKGITSPLDQAYALHRADLIKLGGGEQFYV